MAMPRRAWSGPPAAGNPPPAAGADRRVQPLWGRWTRIRSVHWTRVAVATALVVSVAATVVLEARARASTAAALDLTHWLTGALELDRSEGAALATPRPASTARLARRDAAFGRRSARTLARLPQGQRPQLAALARTYQVAVHAVVADLATGQIGRARQVDAGIETAAFDAFTARVQPLAQARVAQSYRDQRSAGLGALVVLGLGGLLISGLILSGRRLRIHNAELDGERLALVRSEARLRALVHHGCDIVLVLDRSGRTLTWASPSAERLLGTGADTLVERPLAQLLHPGDVGRLDRLLQAARDRPNLVGQLNLRLRHAGGDWRDFETAVSNLLDQPEVGGWVFNARDVTDRRALERELRHAAYHDSLTGLLNRAGFARTMQRTLEGKAPAALILINLSAFKHVNDLYGHDAGDRLLTTVANRLQAGAGDDAIVARLGGDEFAVLLPAATDGAAAEALARSLVAAIGERTTAGIATSVRARAGIALAAPGVDADGLQRQADFALQAVRDADGTPVHRFTPETEAALQEQVALEQDLAVALDRRELVLHFQPVIRLTDGGITGMEALLRWERPGHGLMLPAGFIPMAERTGLIIPIGRWVVGEACAQLARWRQRYPLAATWRMGVNLSPRQLVDPRLVDEIAAVLRACAVEPDRLVLEVTETMVAQDADAAVELLSRLRGLGVGVALDDFGTGYSSLSNLVRLPVDAIKIDRSFVAHLGSDPLAANVLAAVIRMASGLRMHPVAEGVETAEQAICLRGMGCHLVQGYYFARPMAPKDLEGLLAAGRFRLPAVP